MKPAKPASATMHEQSFVPSTMRALYFNPPPSATQINTSDTRGVTTSTTSIPNVTFDATFPTPKPSPMQYLIKVQAAALSPDEFVASIRSSPTLSMPKIPVHSLCGTVISTPLQDHQNLSGPKFKIGDAVYGLLDQTRDGCAADFALALESELAFRPKNVTASEGASIPLPALTSWQALFVHGRVLESVRTSGGDGGCDGGGTGRRADSFRVLITNAHENDVGLQAVRLLRSLAMDPLKNAPSATTSGENAGGLTSTTRYRPIWVCTTCSTPREEASLRQEANVDDVLVLNASDADLASSFHSKGLLPVDLVLDCNRHVGNGKTMFQQAHSPIVVKDNGTVLCTNSSCIPSSVEFQSSGKDGDVGGAQADESLTEQIRKRGLISRVVAVRPDGNALQTITDLVESTVIRGRVGKVIDLVEGPSFMNSLIDGSKEKTVKADGMFVIRVNQFE